MKAHTKFFAMTIVLASGMAAAQQAPNPAVAAARQACATEIQSMCSDKQGRQVFACLRDNNDKLGADCKTAMSKLPARRPNPNQAPPQQ